MEAIRFTLGADADIRPVPGAVLLFCGNEQQQIHELNESGARLADRLRDGATRDELVAELTNGGMDPATAAAWAEGFLNNLAAVGALESVFVGDRTCAATEVISVAGVAFRLDYQTADLSARIHEAYRHLAAPKSAAVRHQFSLYAEDDFVFIRRDGGAARVVETSTAAVVLKGMILEQVLDEGEQLAALHAACLVRGDRATLLLGSPGAGKTTFALELMSRGFRYAADDVTLVLPGGAVCGVPLAPGLKEGSWQLAERLGWETAARPTHLRPDGQQVRFMPLAPPDVDAGSQAVGTVLMLRRAEGAEPSLHPVDASAALSELFRESRSRTCKCTPQIFRSLVDIVAAARCFELEYSESAAAAALVAASC